jgi:hypothetical protein
VHARSRPLTVDTGDPGILAVCFGCMSVAHPAASAPRFASVYVRLVVGLGVILVGGWVALLLFAQGDGIAALAVLIGSAMVGGQRAGAWPSVIVLVEAVALVVLGLQLPLFAYVWADTGPLTLIAVAILQAPIALAVTRLSRD